MHLFNDKYQILRPLNVVSGEADLYVCVPLESESGSPSELVIKHYRPGFRPSQEVLEKLVAITSPHCLVPLEVGQFDGRPYEVYEYLRAGTLIDVPRETSHNQEFAWALVGQLASAMQILQECQLLHRDLSPQIFCCARWTRQNLYCPTLVHLPSVNVMFT